ncbi:MAG: VWA domain-containing protein [Flavobacteriales bacterium]|nr:VWA domain-containing protein [Flavobacteriales bacterium]
MLYLLVLIPIFALVYVYHMRWRKKSLHLFADSSLVDHTIPLFPKHKPLAKFFLFGIAFIFIILGLANPQIGSKLEEVKREGIDLMLAIDLSNSMLAEDLTPNRLEKSKRAISKLIDRLHSDRIGIVVFGGDAYTQLPLTTDYAAAKLFLSTISTDIIPTQGTNIAAAIEQSLKGFDEQSKAGKAIVIITDGENHEDDAVKAAENAAEEGITVHTVGMGSSQGVPIPIYRNGQRIGYRKDKEGNSVVTKLNEVMLQELAVAGKGLYVRATNSDAGLDLIMDELETLETAEYGSKVFTDYEDRFQYFVGFGIFLLILEFLISEKRNRWLKALKLFENKSNI